MNIAEILKYCQTGMKLYSPIYGDLSLESVYTPNSNYPIYCSVLRNGHTVSFTKDGKSNTTDAECTLFPSKKQRDWNKFRLPIKRGDIMMDYDGSCPFIAAGELYENISPKYICGINSCGEFKKYPGKGGWTLNFYIPASEEAKKELFDKMKEAGYKWNPDTLELENIENKLKKQQFKPFDKVLVRNDSNKKWSIELFSYYDEEDKLFHYVCLSGCYHYCIPYEGNEYLLGKT